MKTSKTLLLVKDSDSVSIESEISRWAAIGWQTAIEIRSIDSKKLTKKETINKLDANTVAMLSEFAEAQYARVLIQKGLLFDIEVLQFEGVPAREVESRLTILRLINEELKAKGLHWQSHADKEWEKSTLRSATPAVWVQQFAELGCPEIGINLLKCLKVVTDAELRSAFHTTDADKVGLRILHAYVHDEEPGSSSIAIKNVLDHMYPPGEVVKVDLDVPDSLQHLKADVLNVYEDGLWSGVELVRRLKAICASESFSKSALEIHFRYGVTSDAGLCAARMFAKESGTSRLQFRSARAGHHFKFLKDGVDTCFENLGDRKSEAIRAAIDSQIAPYAFQSVKIWGACRNKAIETCEKIGSQLILPFLEKKQGQKLTATAAAMDEKPPQIEEKTLSRWHLGACGFASTVVFASSIPKPVLPLMWLTGQVTINGKTVNWRPLFWDARRTYLADAMLT